MLYEVKTIGVQFDKDDLAEGRVSGEPRKLAFRETP